MWPFLPLHIELSEGEDYISITLGYSTLPDELKHAINYFLLNQMKKLAYGHNMMTMTDTIGILMWGITKPSLFILFYVPANCVQQRDRQIFTEF